MSSLSKFTLSRCVQSIKDSKAEALAKALATKAAGEVVEVAQPGRVKVGESCGRATTELLW